MKSLKLIMVSAFALVLVAGSTVCAAYSQEETVSTDAATATDEQKITIPPSKCNIIIPDINSAKDDAALRSLAAGAFSEPCAYENYEKFVADAKTASEDPAFNNKDYLYYAIALARVEQLAALSKSNDIEAGRLYMSVNDKYFSEAIEHLDKAAASTKSKSLAIDNNMLRFVLFRENLQPDKSDAAFDAVAYQIAKYSDDPKENRKELENVAERLRKLGLPKYAVKIKILYASKVAPEISKEILEDLRISADNYFEKNEMKEAADLYEQYMDAGQAYYSKEDMGAKVMEVGEKYFTAGKYKDAKKYYTIYMDRYSDLPPADYCSYKLALASYYMKDHIRTISQLENFLEKYKNSAWFDMAFETLSKVYYENLPREKALENLQALIDKYYRRDTGDYAQVLMAMLYYGAKNYDSAEDKLRKIEPSSSCYYASRAIIDDIKDIKTNKTAPAFGSDATEAYKIWEPYQGIEINLVPTIANAAGEKQSLNMTGTKEGIPQVELEKGAKVQFALQDLVDEDKFNEYTIDKDDQSRLPKMVKEETEKDLLRIHWAVDGGKFADDKETDAKTWIAPDEPGTYKLNVKVDDFGLARVPNKGVRKDTGKDIDLIIVVK